MYNRVEYKGYICPACKNTDLNVTMSKIKCQKCRHTFSIYDKEIIQFDLIADPQRTVFDDHHKNLRCMSKEQIETSKRLFATCSKNVIQGSCNGKNILDMACGKGELTIGIASSELLTDCNIYAFDHSVESLRVLLRSKNSLELANTLYLSGQDVNQMAYPNSFFDYIFGNAILHHFTNYETVLKDTYNLLVDGGKAVFTEPFLNGYALFVSVLKIIENEPFMEKIIDNEPESLGLFHFIINDIMVRSNNYQDKSFLSSLTDKHLFLDDTIHRVASNIGFSVELDSTKTNEEYEHFIDDLLSTYQIVNPEVVHRAREIYSSIYLTFQQSFNSIFSHFKRIILTK